MITLFILFTLILTSPHDIFAQKKPNPKAPASVTVSTSLMRYKRGINVYFKNLHLARSVSYTLSYTSQGEPRGVVGTIDPKKKYSLSRQFLFGTCSSGVCRIDKDVKNVVLEVVTTFKNGKSSAKKYKIKV